MKRSLIRIVTIILIVSFLSSIKYIIKNIREDKEQKEIFEGLEEIEKQETKIKENEQDKNQNLKQLYELNNDFVGWLKIENANVNYPVMQTDSNRKDYYLKKNFYKRIFTIRNTIYCRIL